MTRRADSEQKSPAAGEANVTRLHMHVRESILRGEMRPGEEVSVDELARKLGSNATSLGEALRMLQREGLLESANNQPRVAGYSMPELEQLYVMRLMLEATGIRLTIPQLTAEDLAALESALAQMAHFADEEDYDGWDAPHRQFHAGLVSRSGDRMAGMLAQLSDHAERYRRLYTTTAPRAWSQGLVEHRAILDAAKAADRDLAAERLVSHLARTAFTVISLVNSDYDPAALRDVLRQLIGADRPAEVGA